MANKQIVAVDFSAIFYKAYLGQSQDTPLNIAKDISLSTISRIASLFRDAAIVIVCDSPKNWRKARDSQYKANREKQPDAFFQLMNSTKERLVADGYVLLEESGYEADDVIASICVSALHNGGYEVIIASPDKDLLQLVGPGVRQLRTHDMFLPDGTTLKLWDVAMVANVFGVTPNRLADFLAVVGDASDNVPGIEGVGGKGGAALINEFGSLKTILVCVEGLGQAPSPISPFTQKSLSKWKNALDRFFLIKPIEACKRMDLNRELVGLKSDVKIDIESFFAPKVIKDISQDGWSPDSYERKKLEKKNEEPLRREAREHPEILADFIEIGTPTQEKPKDNVTAALTTIDPMDQFNESLQPTGMQGLWWFCNRALVSRMYPNFGTTERAMLAVMRGRDYGLSPTASLELLQIIEGKVCPPAAVKRAMCQRHPDCLYFVIKDVTPESATAVTCRKTRDGKPGPEQTFTYTLEDAKRAKLVKPGGGWEKNPGAMCAARASGWLANWAYADAVGGIYSFEEMEGENHG
jgi:5'-3' exonuclease